MGGFIEDIDAMAVCGTPNQVVDDLNTRLERGAGEFAVIFGDLGMEDSLELFATRVLPELASPR